MSRVKYPLSNGSSRIMIFISYQKEHNCKTRVHKGGRNILGASLEGAYAVVQKWRGGPSRTTYRKSEKMIRSGCCIYTARCLFLLLSRAFVFYSLRECVCDTLAAYTWIYYRFISILRYSRTFSFVNCFIILEKVCFVSVKKSIFIFSISYSFSGQDPRRLVMGFWL